MVALLMVPVGAAVLVTVIGPVVAVEGTVAFSWVAETCVVDAACPLNLTAELELKPAPWIVTTVPVGPLAGLKLVSENVGVKVAALVPVPAAVVTAILPAVAAFGTTAVTLVGETNVTVGEGRVPNLTVAPGTKLVPLIVTALPVIPELGVNELTAGGP